MLKDILFGNYYCIFIYPSLFHIIPLTRKLVTEVVVAQLVERSLPLPEVSGSNPVIGKKIFILNICLLSTVY